MYYLFFNTIYDSCILLKLDCSKICNIKIFQYCIYVVAFTQTFFSDVILICFSEFKTEEYLKVQDLYETKEKCKRYTNYTLCDSNPYIKQEFCINL